MPRKGWIASVAFAAMCLGGMATLLSQAGLSDSARPLPDSARRTTLDPGGDPRGDFGRLVPESLRAGVELQTRRPMVEVDGSKTILRLR